MQIIRVNKENYHEFDDMIYWRVHGKESKDNQKTEISDEIIKELDNENLYIYSAVVDSKMVGWISLIYLPKVGKYNGKGHVYVDELWVESSFRGMGIGKRLLDKADELKEEIQASGIRLYVSQDNIFANKLYESKGYMKSGETYFMEK